MENKPENPRFATLYEDDDVVILLNDGKKVIRIKNQALSVTLEAGHIRVIGTGGAGIAITPEMRESVRIVNVPKSKGDR